MSGLWARLRAWLETGHQRRTRTYNATHGAVTTRDHRTDDGWGLPRGTAHVVDFEPSPQFKMPESMGIDWIPGRDYHEQELDD